MKLVHGDISGVSYKKLTDKLSGYSKEQLWKVLDHYIFNKLEDAEVAELLTILNSGRPEGDKLPKPIEAAYGDDIIRESDPADDTDRRFLFAISSRELESKFRPRFFGIADEQIVKNRYSLDLAYDPCYFSYYLYPKARKTAAQKLIEYAENNNIPVQGHWLHYARE